MRKSRFHKFATNQIYRRMLHLLDHRRALLYWKLVNANFIIFSLLKALSVVNKCRFHLSNRQTNAVKVLIDVYPSISVTRVFTKHCLVSKHWKSNNWHCLGEMIYPRFSSFCLSGVGSTKTHGRIQNWSFNLVQTNKLTH